MQLKGATTKIHIKRGDTIVEVLLAITIYSLVALFTITAMRLGIQQGEASLELSQARIEVAAQADAIRFIHNSFLAEREYALSSGSSYKALWQALVANAVESSDNIRALSVDTSTATGCPASVAHSFIVNPRNISPSNPASTVLTGKYYTTQLYPRLIFGTSSSNSDSAYEEGAYTGLYRAEGIWVVARKSAKTSGIYDVSGQSQPEYYDFHIYTCWFAPGSSHPSTTGTIIRLYNPALRETIR